MNEMDMFNRNSSQQQSTLQTGAFSDTMQDSRETLRCRIKIALITTVCVICTFVFLMLLLGTICGMMLSSALNTKYLKSQVSQAKEELVSTNREVACVKEQLEYRLLQVITDSTSDRTSVLTLTHLH